VSNFICVLGGCGVDTTSGAPSGSGSCPVGGVFAPVDCPNDIFPHAFMSDTHLEVAALVCSAGIVPAYIFCVLIIKKHSIFFNIFETSGVTWQLLW
jgi:hypothetical protein